MRKEGSYLAAPTSRGMKPVVKDMPPEARTRQPIGPIDAAIKYLGARVQKGLEGFDLDGRPAQPRDLVAAANLAGAKIPYPGVRPL